MREFVEERRASGWFVITTHPQREAYALDNLGRQGFVAYCPMIIRRIRHARRVRDVPRPLFPSYVFVEQTSALLSWRSLMSTYGVRSLVRNGDVPALLNDKFVVALRARERDGVLAKPEQPFQIGQNVELRGGPFDGLVGTVMELREKDRIVVLMNLLNQPTRVLLNGDALSPV